MPLAASAARKEATWPAASRGSRHWLGVLVNSWIADAPTCTPRAGACATPPCDEEVGETLDGVDPRREPREDRGLIATAGADLQHGIAAAWSEHCRHQGDDKRLGDGLPVADRQRRVFVGVGHERRRHEPLARR